MKWYGEWDSMVRLRVSEEQVHYAGGLVDGAFVIKLFGDVATELLIIQDGDEGLFRAYDHIEFLNPVRAGDYLEVLGKMVKAGNTSRRMEFIARKVITSIDLPGQPSACEALTDPVVVCRAAGTCVVPKEFQRYSK
ncbi:MAG: hotdog domain-containing protein [Bacillota bacterium]